MQNNIGLNAKNFLKTNQAGVALIIAALIFVATITLNPRSLNINTFGSILAITSMLILASAGQTLVVVSDGIDMSVGANMSMSAILAVTLMQGTDSIGLFLLAFVVCSVVGIIIGFCNGVGSEVIGLPPMVVTLYIANIITRLQYVIGGGTPEHTSVPDWVKEFLTLRLFSVLPVVAFFALAYFFTMYILMGKTRYGQQLYLTGNNKRAALLTGIKTRKIKILNYTIAGLLASFAGFIGAGNSGFIKSGMFDPMTMESIVAVVVGGALLSGGRGKFTGTLAGAILLVVLSNSLAVLQINDSMKNLIMGVVLIVILSLYNRAKPIRI